MLISNMVLSIYEELGTRVTKQPKKLFHTIYDKTKTNKATDHIGYALESKDAQLSNEYLVSSVALLVFVLL